ncbi:hypothetical protein [Fictibacillus terranigra]|uniref:Uncharacterized protein n=1 Tax=Fictibacillus terranigra TaxID=3058424 RepID=A0ABT8ECI8_9BACL|nr:hypothetical protein [Fictibacillus sp. CENA-BCM004]MDN4075629.1 hypothetical protein [Fictibacillus sp. CENA-BCM004]
MKVLGGCSFNRLSIYHLVSVDYVRTFAGCDPVFAVYQPNPIECRLPTAQEHTLTTFADQTKKETAHVRLFFKI